jgi:hypothetical protein
MIGFETTKLPRLRRFDCEDAKRISIRKPGRQEKIVFVAADVRRL